jgi:hypothetical protein
VAAILPWKFTTRDASARLQQTNSALPAESEMAGNWVRIALAVTGGVSISLAAFFITLGILTLWDRQDKILQSVIVKNSAHRIESKQPISSDPRKARVTEGIALADGSITPKDTSSIIRVHIRTYVWSDRGSTAAIAIFRDGQEEALQIFTKPLPSPVTQEVIAVLDLPASVAPTLGFHLRIGPADEGSIMINGKPSSPGIESTITIVEIERPKTN